MDRLKKIKLNFLINKNDEPENYENFVYWPGSQPPPNPEFQFEKQPNNKIKLLAKDTMLFESSNDETNDDFNYFIATIDPRKSGQLLCKQAKLYRMMPSYKFKDLFDEKNANDDDDSVRLTKREQMEELKEKFSSKKTQRDLANKRKYEIHFADGDAENLPIINNNDNDSHDIDNNDDEKNNRQSNNKKKINDNNDEIEQQSISSSSILPERNEMAKNVDDVYRLNDIITDEEEQSIKEFERELFDKIQNDYIKELIQKNFNINNSNGKERIMAIYADLLLQMLKLSIFQMRKADPLPLIVGDIKKFLFERYTSTKTISSRQQQYILTDQNKDRILVNIFIIIIILNNYRPVDLDRIQQNFSVKMSHLRRIFELIGCYIENSRQISGLVSKVACFRLPLNVYKDSKKMKFKFKKN